MVSLFSSTSKKTVGVDIGTSSIKIVELTKDKKTKLSNYAHFHNSKEGSSQYSSFKTDYNIIVDVIRRLFDSAGITEKKVFMSIPIALSFSTIFSLPKMKSGDLKKAIQFEAKKFIPVPMDDIHFDWSELKHISNKSEQKVLVVAVPNDVLSKYYAIVKALGLSLEGIELESFSMARSLVNDTDDSIMILDTGSRLTNIITVEKQMVGLHYYSSVSAMRIVQRLSQSMSISYDRAFKIFHEQGIESNKQVQDATSALFNDLASEMKKINEDYTCQGGSPISQVVITGSLSHIPGFNEYLQNYIETPVITGDPFSNNIEVPKGVSPDLSVDLSVAVGLAMKMY